MRHLKWIRRLLFGLALAGAGLAQPSPAFACSCAQPGTPAEAVAQADAVFLGTVAGVRFRTPSPWLAGLLQRLPGVQMPYGVDVSIRVNTAWKGISARDVTVTTGYGDADCGFVFSARQQYLVYAFADPDGLRTHICSRTTGVNAAAADLAYLASLPPLKLPPASAAPARLTNVTIGLGLLLAGLSGLAWAGKRRLRKG